MRTISHRLVALAPLSLLMLTADAQEWTRFHGPGGAGSSDATTIPTTITEKDYNWNIELPGSGHSSPVLWGNTIFLTGVDREKGDIRYVFAVGAQDGMLLWKTPFPFDAYDQHKFNSYASSTPAVDAERVYVTWTTPKGTSAVALDHEGRKLWEKDLGGFFARHGSGSSPIVVGKTLIVTNDHEKDGGFLAGLDSATGKELWKIDRKNIEQAPYNTPAEFTPEGGKKEVIFSSTAYGLSGIDPETGTILWNVNPEFSNRCVSSPVIAGDIIFATAGQGGGGKESIAIRPGKGGEPKELYRVQKRIPYVPTGVAHKGNIFLINDAGLMLCMNAESGDVLWEERVTGPTYSSPVCINGYLYAISREGELAVVKASEKFEPVSTHKFKAPVDATPAVANGTLYVRTTDRLISIGGKK